MSVMSRRTRLRLPNVYLDGSDLCGFNLKRFDLKVLAAEFRRVGIEFPLDDRAVIDPMEIYHQRERRDLAAAVRFFCGRGHEGAHGASADALATAEILDAMLERYPDLPRLVDELDQLFLDQKSADLDGKFVKVDDRLVFAFGKYRGRHLEDVAQESPGYLSWMLADDFLEDTKSLVREALGHVRERPGLRV
jgi:DNA polymerase-3 subunit epsilon